MFWDQKEIILDPPMTGTKPPVLQRKGAQGSTWQSNVAKEGDI